MKQGLFGWKWLALLSAAVVIASAAYAVTRNSDEKLFIAAAVQRGTIATYVKATGTVDPVITVDVSSQLSGRIAEVLVNDNDAVTQGQVIARLDPDAYDARVSEARAALKVARANALLQKASLERAEVALRNSETARKVEEAQLQVGQAKQGELERDYQRFLILSRTGGVAERDMTQARALRDVGAASLRVIEQQINLKADAVEIARAEIAMAEANLVNAEAVVEQKQAALDQAEVDRERTQIRAPIDGIVIKRDVNPGQTVAVTLEAKTLFKIAHDLREMELRGRIDEADVGKLRIGQATTFTVDAYPDRQFNGKVLQIRKSPETTQNVVTYTAMISAPNADLLLMPGMTATLRIMVAESEDTLTIPSQSLRFRPAGESGATAAVPEARTSATIWLLDAGGTPISIPVRLGKDDGNIVQVLSDNIREGQQVIVGVATPRSHTGWLGLRLGY
jgi:HlyD family secretion protein